MTSSIGFLGPPGTYSEQAAVAYQRQIQRQEDSLPELKAYPSILQVIQSVSNSSIDFAVVPVENSIEGGVTVTLDALWQLPKLKIQHALIIPISHALLTASDNLQGLSQIYSHPQALGQCQQWIQAHCPQASLVPTSSTTEVLKTLEKTHNAAAIASKWAADLYGLPVLAHPINDRPDNFTKFWVLGRQDLQIGAHTSLAFSLPANVPGGLLAPLKIMFQDAINLSRIESRPTKRSLGEYLFFLDLEAGLHQEKTQRAIHALRECTETLRIFGSYYISTQGTETNP
ncbi:MAG: prephenate dehydratase [Leptolyngbyaceae cyanobacterium]